MPTGHADDTVCCGRLCWKIKNLLQHWLPRSPKGKCIHVVGKKRAARKPAPLTLGGHELPWEQSVVHLGHELHESGNIDHDSVVKWAQFMDILVAMTWEGRRPPRSTVPETQPSSWAGAVQDGQGHSFCSRCCRVVTHLPGLISWASMGNSSGGSRTV